MWQEIGQFNKAHQEDKDIISSILDCDQDKYRINAADINVKVPDVLLTTCEKEIHRVSEHFEFDILEGTYLQL